MRLPPGRFGLPVVGETLSFLKNPRAFLEQRKLKYGPVFKTNLLGNNTVYALTNEGTALSFRQLGTSLENQWPASTRALLGEHSLAVVRGGKHRRLRAFFKPVFNRSAMARQATAMEPLIASTLQTWAATSSEGGVALVFPGCKDFTFNVSLQLMAGTHCSEDEARRWRAAFKVWIKGLFSLPINLPFTDFGRALVARRVMFDICSEMVDRVVHARDAVAPEAPTVLERFVHAEEPYSRDEIADNLLIFLFAGHDTSSCGLTWILHHLQADRTDFLQRLRAEVDATEERWAHAGSGGERAWSELADLPLLNAAVSEGLRMHPPVGGGFREVLEEMDIDGHRVPKGYTFAYNISSGCQDPANWVSPELYLPTRFLHTTTTKDAGTGCPAHVVPSSSSSCPSASGSATTTGCPVVHPSALPMGAHEVFGGGTRKCVGKNLALLELRQFLFMAVRDYVWKSVGEPIVNPFPIPAPHNDMPMRFSPRAAGT